jgi:NAD(P)-dependent dehydrogenase (short-subunit alcohol dehydrogenase family)
MGTFFITGSTGGIGTEVAIALARAGHRLLLGARSSNPANAMSQRLRREVPNASFEVVMGDLSLMSEVHRVAEAVGTLTPDLDGLLLNAGAAPARMRLTHEGMETGFAVNHLGAFALSHWLLPLLASGDGGRIVLTGSSDHLAVKQVDVHAASTGEHFSYGRAYAEAKLLAMASMLELSRRLQGDPATANVLVNIADPGWTHTGLTREAPLPIRMLVALGRPFQNTTIEAARVLASLAMDAQGSGQFLGRKGPGRLSDLVQDPATQARIYTDTLAVLKEAGGVSAPNLAGAAT